MRRLSLVMLAFLALVFAFKPMTNKETKSFETHYGICNLSTIPVRASNSHKSEIVTQLLFGEVFTVTENSEDGEWKKIKMEYDGYEGWIANFQFKEISESFFNDYNSNLHAVNHEGLSQISHPELGRQYISIGSVLPFYKDGKFKIGDELFELENPQAIKNNTLLSTAHEYLHTPYLWGGKSIFGIDCSGFVQQVFKSAKGLKLPRDAYQQADHGKEIHFNNHQEGDLAFFENDKGRITHVGILTGNGKIIHASGRVKIDDFTQQGIVCKDTQKQTHKLSFIKRVEGQVD